MEIVSIWRYPIKSVGGEQLAQAEVAETGIVGDRHWSIRDVATGKSLTARREPALLFASASCVGQSDDLEVHVVLPDGTKLRGVGDGTDRELNNELSAWLDRPVELQASAPGMTGTFETQLTVEETGEWIDWTGATGSFHDSARRKVSLVSASTMGEWDERRFRINLIVDGTGEDDLLDTSVRVGDCVLDVVRLVDRCVVVTRPQPGLERDLSVLKTINAERGSNLGIGCLVNTAGMINVGDAVIPV